MTGRSDTQRNPSKKNEHKENGPFMGQNGLLYPTKQKTEISAEHLEQVFGRVDGQSRYGPLHSKVGLAVGGLSLFTSRCASR